MWARLLDRCLITPPAMWGTWPGHADLVQSGVRRGEGEAWASWLFKQTPSASAGLSRKAAAVPVAFVLPPGALAFASRRFVLGVIARSTDLAGHHQPLVIYQQANAHWVKKHFEAQRYQPCDWQFWLARAVARHMLVEDAATAAEMTSTLKALWRDQKRAFFARPNTGWSHAETMASARLTHALLDRRAGRAPEDDPVARLQGVRHLPWADWPQRLSGACVENAFWQQDAQGRFVGAANRLEDLWSGLE